MFCFCFLMKQIDENVHFHDILFLGDGGIYLANRPQVDKMSAAPNPPDTAFVHVPSGSLSAHCVSM